MVCPQVCSPMLRSLYCSDYPYTRTIYTAYAKPSGGQGLTARGKTGVSAVHDVRRPLAHVVILPTILQQFDPTCCLVCCQACLKSLKQVKC